MVQACRSAEVSGWTRRSDRAECFKWSAETKALNLESFGTNKHFGGSSGAIGKLTHSGVVEVILDTIGTHLSDLRYLSLADNQLKFLKDFSKLHEKAPNIHTLHLQKNQVSYYLSWYFLRIKMLLSIIMINRIYQPFPLYLDYSLKTFGWYITAAVNGSVSWWKSNGCQL